VENNTCDLNRIYDKLDKMGLDIASTKTDIEVIKMRFNMIPPAPQRPCEALESHLKEHEETKATWRRPIVSAVVETVRFVIFAVIAYIIAIWKRNP